MRRLGSLPAKKVENSRPDTGQNASDSWSGPQTASQQNFQVSAPQALIRDEIVPKAT
jgi:hypothetical protein